MVSIVTGAIGLLVAAIIIVLMRKDSLHAQHGLGWIIVALCFALLGFSPEVIDHIAQRFGVSYPPVLALTLAIAILVIKILLMDIERSRIEMRNQRLIQRMAMLEADVKLLRKNGPHNIQEDEEAS
ncbi:MAG: DUF2304 domain-containing protein [Halioglobus sp.]